jgi:hypothetical protein
MELHLHGLVFNCTEGNILGRPHAHLYKIVKGDIIVREVNRSPAISL